MTDITELAQRARINAECGEHLSPAETMELVEALELKEEQRANWFQMAQCLYGRLYDDKDVDSGKCPDCDGGMMFEGANQ